MMRKKIAPQAFEGKSSAACLGRLRSTLRARWVERWQGSYRVCRTPDPTQSRRVSLNCPLSEAAESAQRSPRVVPGVPPQKPTKNPFRVSRWPSILGAPTPRQSSRSTDEHRPSYGEIRGEFCDKSLRRGIPHCHCKVGLFEANHYTRCYYTSFKDDFRGGGDSARHTPSY